MTFCTECGAAIEDDVKFCTKCGNSVEKPEPPVSKPAAPPLDTAPQTASGSYPTQLNYDDGAPHPGSVYAPLSTGAFVGYSILFYIPVLGWLICLVMVFIAKNVNLRNYARATLIFILIGLVFMVIFYFLADWAFRYFTNYLNENFNGDFRNFAEQIIRSGR